MNFPRHRFYFFPLLATIGAVLLTYAYFIEPSRLVVNHSTIQIKGWDATFDGLKIAMIGDVHGGSNGATEEKLREVVKRTNEQSPDLIVLLGDYVSQNSEDKPFHERSLRMPIKTIATSLSGLQAKYGVFAVLGNHDGWFGDERVAGELSRVGYRVLQNEVALIEKDGHRLRIFGMKDHLHLPGGWHQASLDAKTIVEKSGTGDLIVLEHSPDILHLVSGEFSISPELKLMLAAHTHGGQVRFPILGTPIVPSSYGQKYVYGHIKSQNVDMFVTSGIGTSILPFRFMVPPEIAVVTIRTALPSS